MRGGESAVVQCDGGDVTERHNDAIGIVWTEAQQAGVARGAVRLVVPEREQQGAFEQKTIGEPYSTKVSMPSA